MSSEYTYHGAGRLQETYDAHPVIVGIIGAIIVIVILLLSIWGLMELYDWATYDPTVSTFRVIRRTYTGSPLPEEDIRFQTVSSSRFAAAPGSAEDPTNTGILDGGRKPAALPAQNSSMTLIPVKEDRTIKSRLADIFSTKKAPQVTHVAVDSATGESTPVSVTASGTVLPASASPGTVALVPKSGASGKSTVDKLKNLNPFRTKTPEELAAEAAMRSQEAAIKEAAKTAKKIEQKQALTDRLSGIFGFKKNVPNPIRVTAPTSTGTTEINIASTTSVPTVSAQIPIAMDTSVNTAAAVSNATTAEILATAAVTQEPMRAGRFIQQMALLDMGDNANMDLGDDELANMTGSDTDVRLHHSGNLGVGFDPGAMRHSIDFS